jgi:capsular polysaccharide export protein
LADHPACTVVLKVHPDVIHGRARGHFSAKDLVHPRIRVSADGLHPAGLLQRAEAVYAVTSQMGFEALLWGRPVHCFGMPFYAGWGLTHDRLAAPDRRQQGVSLEALVHGALIAYPHCIDPHQHEPCSIETLMRAIGLQRRMHALAPRSVQAFGFTPWKQRNLRRFLAGSEVRYPMPWMTPDTNIDAVAVWGRRGKPRVLSAADRRRLPTLHVEDGFLRSVGLGADLIDPISWVVDGRGMYYDATGPSDLEILLAHGDWSVSQLERAAQLRHRLVRAAITKYNLQSTPWQRPNGIQRVVLVVGQVESDASIRFGAPGVCTNLGLLQAVRAAEPEAYLVYKPHPDVSAGLCRAGEGEEIAQECCDEVLTSGSIDQLFTQIDALHVLTSLAGFEGILRGVEVHCWGLPFYAGWGLTRDRETCPRRGRCLELDALVHAALIEYPRYVSRGSGWFITPEQAIDELIAWKDGPTPRRTLVQALFRHWGRLRRR